MRRQAAKADPMNRTKHALLVLLAAMACSAYADDRALGAVGGVQRLAPELTPCCRKAPAPNA